MFATEAFFINLDRPRPTTFNYYDQRTDKEQDKLNKFSARSRPVIHEDVIGMAEEFLKKQSHSIYDGMNLVGFVDRLIRKRPLVFINSSDEWMDKYGNEGCGDWDKKAKKDIENFLTYEEIKISALIQLSTETLLINSGGRDNNGVPGPEGTFIKEAVYVGAVGARFEKRGKMDHEDCVIFQDPQKQEKSFELERIGQSEYYFDVCKYKKRMKLSFETFLLEANSRGEQQRDANRRGEQRRKVYCHVVGLGLGVWQLPGYQNQTKHFFDAFEESLDILMKRGLLNQISDLDFSWVFPPSDVVFKNQKLFKNSNLKIHISRNDPFGKSKEKVSFSFVYILYWYISHV